MYLITVREKRSQLSQGKLRDRWEVIGRVLASDGADLLRQVTDLLAEKPELALTVVLDRNAVHAHEKEHTGS